MSCSLMKESALPSAEQVSSILLPWQSRLFSVRMTSSAALEVCTPES